MPLADKYAQAGAAAVITNGPQAVFTRPKNAVTAHRSKRSVSLIAVTENPANPMTEVTGPCPRELSPEMINTTHGMRLCRILRPALRSQTGARPLRCGRAPLFQVSHHGQASSPAERPSRRALTNLWSRA